MVYNGFGQFSGTLSGKKVFLVCGKSFDRMSFSQDLKKADVTRFGGFTPNHPDSREIEDGVEAFRKSGCGTILAVGGGSAIDTAKCIRLYSGVSCKLCAVPTTAGTGSERTHFAVMYKDNVKQSVTDDSILPDDIVYVPEVLGTLSPYMKKASMLDAVCHAVESSWSRRATDKSRKYSVEALELILPNAFRYLDNDNSVFETMLEGAGLAGMAINITTTTAAHAMCYRLSEKYSLQHGHAAALCLSVVWPYLARKNSSAELGIWLDNLENVFDRYVPGEPSGPGSGFKRFLYAVNPGFPVFDADDAGMLAESVNPERLGNFPAALTEYEIRELYLELFETSGKRNA